MFVRFYPFQSIGVGIKSRHDVFPNFFQIPFVSCYFVIYSIVSYDYLLLEYVNKLFKFHSFQCHFTAIIISGIQLNGSSPNVY